MAEVKLSQSWRDGLSDAEVSELKREIKGSPLLMRQLASVLKTMEDKSLKEMITKEGLLEPNWAIRQAELCGYRRALSEMEKILIK